MEAKRAHAITYLERKRAVQGIVVSGGLVEETGLRGSNGSSSGC